MQAPKARSATQNTIMGKVSASPYRKVNTVTTKPERSSNLPVYALLVLMGAALIIFWRNKDQGVAQTGPLMYLTQSAAPDQSTIDNLTNSINALAGQVHTPSPNPPGGASTPQTVSPSSGA